ncbi:MAG TPA: biotin--[acetyl-CoA-carboxylase] ligase [Candidatus Obscuribacterales bacterium]
MFPDHLDLSSLNNLLATRRLGKAPGWANEVWESIPSTNTRALELAKQGAPEGVIVGARQQTAGKGRMGRTWISPPDAGIYLSFLLRPQLPPTASRLMSFAAGVAVLRSVQTLYGFTVGLKWVNDIVYGARKLGGILCEMSPGGETPALIVGIGLNLCTPQGDVPEELVAVATNLVEITNQPPDVNRLAVQMALELEMAYELLLQGHASELLKYWRRYSVTLGKQIRAQSGNRTFEGTATDIAEDGALLVLLDSGDTVSLHAGDVSIRNADGSYA